MAIVYFTSNASTGAGSLAEAVKTASPGDVIRPDETVFERGATIEIVLASQLTLGKNLTLDAGPFRVRLVASGNARLLGLANDVTAEVARFDFIGGAATVGGGIYVGNNSALALNACRIAGCDATTAGGGLFVPATSTAILRDSIVTGCRSPQGGGVSASGFVNAVGATVIGNASDKGADFYAPASGGLTATNSIIGGVSVEGSAPVFVGCVVDVASSDVGFVASPPDDFNVETWTANAWQNWDLRLLDDASDAPSPYRDSGVVDAASTCDFQGNFRGRETNGVATRSPGAYETLQADLFWIGKDAAGAEVVSPSWFNSDGWASSRFATASGDAAPQNGLSVFVDGSIVLNGNNLRLSKLVVGGGALIDVDNSSGATLTAIADQFDFGVGSTLRNVGASTQRFQIGRAALASRFGEWINVQPQFLLGDAAALEIASTAKFATVELYANGFYTNYNLQIANVATVEGDSSGCENIYVSFQKPTARIAANGTPRVACKLVKWTPPTDATSDFTALETGSAPIVFAPSRSATVAGNGSRDDFLIDVSNAQPSGTLALTLTGQTVYGDAPSSAVALTGVARIDERGLTSQTLAVGSGATLNVDGAIVSVETATLGDASSLVVSGGRVDVESLTVADGASVAFSNVNVEAEEVGETDATASAGTDGDDNAGSGATDANTGVSGDAVLTAWGSATVGAASFAGRGYFATPTGTDLTAATFAETVRVVEFGANVETFAATATGPTTAKLEWSATNETARVCVERQNAAAPNGWETIAVA
ncbi:MAG: hypothetical protein IKW13_00770, partial [Thermoguttaceae bacterium]|nr:hypothetical protein [Thermoguttaceae bacterium]